MAERARAVTLQDVAHEAGVSLATASRVLNGSTRQVGEDLRLRVTEAAERLDYSANAWAQAMARGETPVVGLIVGDIADPYFTSIAAGMSTAAEERELLVTIASTMRRPEREIQHVATFRGQRSRALVLAGSRVDDPDLLAGLRREIDAFQRSGGRVVAISQARLPIDTILFENQAGAKDLARELCALGYRSFAVLAGPDDLVTSQDRVRGFVSGLKHAGISRPTVVTGDFTRDGGYAAMRRLIESGARPQCVFAVNDVMAVGAMAACRDSGFELPHDVALAGFDDIVTLRDLTPALTTVRLPLEHAGRLAFELVCADTSARPRRRRVGAEVVIRASTPRLR